jgi:hypothetical protein
VISPEPQREKSETSVLLTGAARESELSEVDAGTCTRVLDNRERDFDRASPAAARLPLEG